MTFQNVLDTFFLREDQDTVARKQGWQDAEQMCYYEDRQEEIPRMSSEEWNTFIDEVVQKNRDEEIPPMTDREVEQLVEREEALDTAGKIEYLAPPPSEILVLMRQDSREVYTDSEDCPPDGDFEHTNWQDLTGVY